MGKKWPECSFLSVPSFHFDIFHYLYLYIFEFVTHMLPRTEDWWSIDYGNSYPIHQLQKLYYTYRAYRATAEISIIYILIYLQYIYLSIASSLADKTSLRLSVHIFVFFFADDAWWAKKYSQFRIGCIIRITSTFSCIFVLRFPVQRE